MAGSQPARRNVGVEPFLMSFTRALPGAGLAPTSVNWPGVAAPPPRRAPPFGGHLVSGPSAPQPGARISAAFGGVPAMDPYAEADLRQRQAAFDRVAREIDVRNAPFAIPALAPEMVVGALDLVGAIAALRAGSSVRPSPLVFTNKDPPPRLTGDTWYTRRGRAAHAQFEAAVNQKQAQGWQAEKMLTTKNGKIRPDALTPARNPADPMKRFNLDLKPDTPSGRRAAARAVKKYTEATENKTRVIFYDPKGKW